MDAPDPGHECTLRAVVSEYNMQFGEDQVCSSFGWRAETQMLLQTQLRC